MEIKNPKVFFPPLTAKYSPEEINKTCMFTGHRSFDPYDLDLQPRMEIELETLINVHGVCTFVAGGAKGFDMLAEATVIRLRSKYPHIRLIIAIPCKNQTSGWNSEDKEEYLRLAEQADELHYVNTDFFNGCMLRRNDYMVSMSAYCVSYLRQPTGGTAYTVSAATRKGLKIIEL